MKLDEIVAWYQKKIGTYDKQLWEKTVEQRIINGFVHISLKNTKLKTELIDVDLVRGSTFPKAKPKQPLLTILRLAVLRLIFLPLFSKWWVQQTSPKVFAFLLTLYLLQMFNWGIYSYHVNKATETETDHIVSISELLIPISLSLILSVIHSNIIATASSNISNDKRKGKLPGAKRKKRERVKRRKKNIRTRETKTSSVTDLTDPKYRSKNNLEIKPIKVNTDFSVNNLKREKSSESISENYLDADNSCCSSNVEINEPSTSCRKRNVNWDSPIKSQVVLSNSDHYVYKIDESGNYVNFNSAEIARDLKIDDAVQEFVEDILERAEQPAGLERIDEHNANGQPGEDDGFESLNGKSSSGEENAVGMNQQISNRYKNNSWFRELVENTQNRLSDSDTDTLKGNNFIRKATSFVKPKVSVSSESEIDFNRKNKITLLPVVTASIIKGQKPKVSSKTSNVSSDTDQEDDDGDGENLSTSPGIDSSTPFTDPPAAEWIGVTTNSEECSYSSELDESDSQNEYSEMDHEYTPNIIPNGVNDKINCTIWDRSEIKKAEMSVLDISSTIIEKVEAMPETCDYIYIGLFLSILLSLIPAFCRLCESIVDPTNSTEINFFEMPGLLLEKASFSSTTILLFAFGDTQWERTILIVGFILRLCLTFIFFFLLAVAERTFKQRFLYAKLFSHLTSSRRSRKSDLPHFRLNKVRNIKTWLSVRSYLKRRGPQRSVDVIVSAAFIITLLLLAFLSVEWLKDSVHLHSQFNLESLIWSCSLGTFILRFMTLGTKINRKYRSISVLITEQINLYLQIEQKPHKKEELMVSNSVLKLAADLLKELESPFKISGLSANPYLYTTVKVVILSALSGVLSEMLGFKLKLHKIKIK